MSGNIHLEFRQNLLESNFLVAKYMHICTTCQAKVELCTPLCMKSLRPKRRSNVSACNTMETRRKLRHNEKRANSRREASVARLNQI